MAEFTYQELMQASANAAAAGDYGASKRLADAAEKYGASTKAPESERGFTPQVERQVTGLGGMLMDGLNMINPISQGANLISQLRGGPSLYPSAATAWTGEQPALGTGQQALNQAVNMGQDALGLNTHVAEHGPTTVLEGAGMGAGVGLTAILPMGGVGKAATGAGETIAATNAAKRLSLLDQATGKAVASSTTRAMGEEAQAAAKAMEVAAAKTGVREAAEARAASTAQAAKDAAAAGATKAEVRAANKIAARAAVRADKALQAEATAHTVAQEAAAAAAPVAPEIASAAAAMAPKSGGLLSGLGRGTVTEAAPGLADDAAAAASVTEQAAHPIVRNAVKLAATAEKRTATRVAAEEAMLKAEEDVRKAAEASSPPWARPVAAANRAAEARAKAATRLSIAQAAETKAVEAANTAKVAAREVVAEIAAPRVGSIAVPKSLIRSDKLGAALRGGGAALEAGSKGFGAVATTLGSTEGSGLSEYAKEHGAGEKMQTAVGLLGGLDLPIASTLAKGAVKIATGRAAKKAFAAAAGNAAKAPMHEINQGVIDRLAAGSEGRAAELAAQINREPGDLLGLTPSELSADPTILGMAANARSFHPAAIAEHEQRLAAMPGRAIGHMPGGTAPIAPGQSKVAEIIDQQVQAKKAEFAAHEATDQPLLDAISPSVGSMQSSKAAVKALQTAKNVSKAEANRAWQAVPNKATVAPSNMRAAAHSVLAERPYGETLPDAAKRVLRIVEYPNVKEVKVKYANQLYSDLKRAVRKEASNQAPNHDTIRHLNTLADSISKDLDALAPTTKIGKQVQAARAATFDHYEKFGNGNMVEGILKGSGGRNPAETAVSKVMNAGNDTSAVAINQILAAAEKGGVAQEVNVHLVDNLKAQFARAAQPNGVFNVGKAKTWMNNNANKLDRMPELRASFQNAIDAKSITAGKKIEMNQAIKELTVNSASAKFVKENPTKMVNALVGANDPEAAADKLLAVVNQDKTGKAKAAVKAAIQDHIVKASGGNTHLNGEALLATLNDGAMPTVLSRFFAPAEIAKWNQVARELSLVQKSPRNVHDLMNPKQSPILESAVRIGASHVPLKTNSIAASTAKIKAIQNMVAPNRNPQINQALHETLQDKAKTVAALNAAAGNAPSPPMGSPAGMIGGLGNAIRGAANAPAKDIVGMVNPLLSSIMGTAAGSTAFQAQQ